MADAIVGEVGLAGLPDDWRSRAAELVRRLRRAMPAHRDGAGVVVGAYAARHGAVRRSARGRPAGRRVGRLPGVAGGRGRTGADRVRRAAGPRCGPRAAVGPTG
ncbi:TetR/AcrR family transcriptional regulator C-terminal domain-containing protein [Actinosynnema sp. NPDC023794]